MPKLVFIRVKSIFCLFTRIFQVFAKCIELGIMAHGETQEEAILEIKEATRVHLLILKEDGDEIPKPFNLREFSGKLNLRMTPEKHREIALKAKTQGVSINHYINSQLK